MAPGTRASKHVEEEHEHEEYVDGTGQNINKPVKETTTVTDDGASMGPRPATPRKGRRVVLMNLPEFPEREGKVRPTRGLRQRSVL